MLPSIDFNDESLLAAYKVANVRSDRLLPDELAVCDLPISQPPPELFLSVGLVDTKPACTRRLHLIRTAHSHSVRAAYATSPRLRGEVASAASG